MVGAPRANDHPDRTTVGLTPGVGADPFGSPPSAGVSSEVLAPASAELADFSSGPCATGGFSPTAERIPEPTALALAAPNFLDPPRVSSGADPLPALLPGPPCTQAGVSKCRSPELASPFAMPPVSAEFSKISEPSSSQGGLHPEAAGPLAPVAPSDVPTAIAFRVLYTFAGIERHCDLRAAIAAALEEDAQRGLFPIDLAMQEVDTLRGGHTHDLSRPELASYWLGRVRNAEFDVVIASPPCNTFSRARHANRRGPPPLRDRVHPRGLPSLTTAQRDQCVVADQLVDFAWSLLEAAVQAVHDPSWRRSRCLLEHPEDLGEARLGCPASIWSPPQTILDSHGVAVPRWAIFQCRFDANLPYIKPTGLLSDCPGLEDHAWQGWPSFQAGTVFKRHSDFVYAGPLPGQGFGCGHRSHTSLIRHAKDKHFRTTGTASWPPGMCQ